MQKLADGKITMLDERMAQVLRSRGWLNIEQGSLTDKGRKFLEGRKP